MITKHKDSSSIEPILDHMLREEAEEPMKTVMCCPECGDTYEKTDDYELPDTCPVCGSELTSKKSDKFDAKDVTDKELEQEPVGEGCKGEAGKWKAIGKAMKNKKQRRKKAKESIELDNTTSLMKYNIQDPIIIEDAEKPVVDMSWQEIAEALYGLLDDIDTADDMFKEDSEAYRKYAYKKQTEKNQYMYSPDGYCLKRVGEVSEDEDKPRATTAEESAVTERQEDVYRSIASGIIDEQQAEEFARENGGFVVPDDEDPEKFQVLLRIEKSDI
jgi:hypothetical protein